MMRGVVFLGNRRVAVKDFPDPEPGPNEALVRVKAATICGSDLHIFRRPEVRDDIVQGHEAAGIVERVGEAVENVKPGERVSVNHHIGVDNCDMCRSGDWFYCKNRWTWGLGIRNGSFGDLLLTHAKGCFRLPRELSFIDGSIISCAGGTAYQGLIKLGVAADDDVVVSGLGPVGLSAVMFAKAIGARIIGVEPIEMRRELALKLGADIVLDPTEGDVVERVKALTAGEGASVVAECSGSADAQSNALSCVRPFGRIGFIGMGARELTIDPSIFSAIDITLTGNHVFNVSLYDRIVRLMVDRGLHLEDMTTHRFSLEQAEEAFRIFDSGRSGKVAFIP